MKFLTKINLNYLVLLTVMLVVISFAGYFIIKWRFQNETREKLEQTSELIKKQIGETRINCKLYPLIDVRKSKSKKAIDAVYKEIFIQNKAEDYEDEPYIELSETVEIKGVFYDLRIRHSMIESEDMLQAIFLPLLFMLLSAFILSFFISKRFNRTVWKDFEENLRAIENYSFAKKENLNLKKSDILEFDRLNTVVSQLINKLGKDYKLLKQFTENASHELQTPLTIISLYLEDLLQEDLPQKQIEKIYATFQSVKRMDKLNKNLLMLTKIENKQFVETQEVDIGALFNQKINEYNILAESKNIEFTNKIKDELRVFMNPDLAATLVNNLLMNALYHNTKNGKIRIFTKPNEISICNTGAIEALDEDDIFIRFVKHNSKSNGLGLAIVKEICNSSALEIVYSFKEGQHCFKIKGTTTNLVENDNYELYN